MSIETVSPFPQFFDTAGVPLDGGKLYYGASGFNPETNPITVYWDSACTQPAAQPVRTIGGYPARNGAVASVYVNGTAYSLTVRTKADVLVTSRLVIGATTSQTFFFTVSLMLADVSAPAAGTVWTATGAGYQYTVVATGGDLVTAGGAQLKYTAIDNKYPPGAFGSVGDGVADDTVALLAMLAAVTNGAAAQVGTFQPTAKIDFLGQVNAISAPLNFSRGNLLVENMNLLAIGGGWTAVNYMVNSTSRRSTFLHCTLDCRWIANGVIHTQQGTKFLHLKVFNMATAWRSTGFYIPSSGGNGNLLAFATIQQWQSTDAGINTQSNMTADCVRIEASDNVVDNCYIGWGRNGYYGRNGIHTVSNSHIYNGVVGFTDAQIIEWAEPASAGADAANGTLYMPNCYFDSGISKFWSDDVIILDAIVLHNSAVMTITQGFWNFIADSSGPNGANAYMTGTFTIWNGGADLIRFQNYLSFTWNPDVIAMATAWNASTIASAFIRNFKIGAVTTELILSTSAPAHRMYEANALSQISFGNSGNPTAALTDTPAIGGSINDLRLDANIGIVNIQSNSMFYRSNAAEPTPLPTFAGFIARSNGTASTRSFGVAGAGMYYFNGTAWSRFAS